MKTDGKELQNMKRQLLLEAPTKDFLLRLDLIDQYPELFYDDNKRSKKLRLTPKELEQLRILMNEQQDKKMFK